MKEKNMCKLYQFIINPNSGSHFDIAKVECLKDYIQSNGGRAQLQITKSPIHTVELVARAKADHCKTVIVCGGDGTVRSVIEAMIGSDIPILIFPMGTENLLARELGLDDSLETILRTLQFGSVTNIDLCRANHMYFISVAGVGFDGDFIRRIHHARSGHIGRLKCFWLALQSFALYGFPPINVIADGKVLCEEPALVMIGNISKHVLGSTVHTQADYMDGLLDICIYKCHSRFHRASFWYTVFANNRNRDKSVIHYQGREIQINSQVKDVPVQVDGEMGPSLPLNITIVPRTVRLFARPLASRTRTFLSCWNFSMIDYFRKGVERLKISQNQAAVRTFNL